MDAANTIVSLEKAGFRLAGRYCDGLFAIDPAWRPKEVVYAWIDRGPALVSAIRFGIASGEAGFGHRYDHYNRWLAGRFKPHDAREQQVRKLFLQRLGEGVEVWAVEVAGKHAALQLEKALRDLWGSVLDLDLMVRDSWAKMEMVRWRSENAAAVPNKVPQQKSLKASHHRDGTALSVLTSERPSVPEMCRAYEKDLCDLGYKPEGGPKGISYHLDGRRVPIRIHPKQSFLRVWVGVAREAEAPTQLRGQYRQKGWLIVRPEHFQLGRDYTIECATAAIAGERW